MDNFAYWLSIDLVSGTVYCFGDGRNGQLGVHLKQQSQMLPTPSSVPINCPAKIIEVDCGAAHTAALSGMTFIVSSTVEPRLFGLFRIRIIESPTNRNTNTITSVGNS